MKTFELDTLCSGVVITEAELEEGFIVKIDKNCFENKDDVFVIRVGIRNEEAEKEQKKEDVDDTIPGHPNCRVGECFGCHVVSCAIYQEYEEMP